MKTVPIIHGNLLQKVGPDGHLVVNITGLPNHEISEKCWCNPFLGMKGYFEDIQGEPNKLVWVHRNYK
jgi:hypothetical protein